ncbi:MAG: hypothetical protein IPL50_16290 [Chitinophagaceae bacterium]|nr:hypothetical protein [Chitinophagaceae bacterium]
MPSVIIETERTRENIIVLDDSNNNQYRFGMPGTRLTETEWETMPACCRSCKDAEFIIASGSLPPGVPLNIYALLAKIAKSNHAKFIVDTSGEALQHAADGDVFASQTWVN